MAQSTDQKHHKKMINALCINCEACLIVCPTQSVFLGRTRFMIDLDTCDGHGLCVKVCPVHAIEDARVEVEIPKRSEVTEEAPKEGAS